MMIYLATLSMTMMNYLATLSSSSFRSFILRSKSGSFLSMRSSRDPIILNNIDHKKMIAAVIHLNSPFTRFSVWSISPPEFEADPWYKTYYVYFDRYVCFQSLALWCIFTSSCRTRQRSLETGDRFLDAGRKLRRSSEGSGNVSPRFGNGQKKKPKTRGNYSVNFLDEDLIMRWCQSTFFPIVQV